MSTSEISVCVFCGSRFGAKPSYTQAAAALGELIASERWRLVYGAGDVGLMGTVANTAQSAGADVLGVIPIHLKEREVGKTDISSFIVTENMHERKKVMFMNSDIIVVLPGGAGSLDEFFEVLTWAQLGLHAKPVFLLNTDGYWNPLIDLIDHIIAEGFADSSLKAFVSIVEDVPTLAKALKQM